MRFLDRVRAELLAIDRAGLARAPRVLDGPTGPEVDLGGRRVLCLTSNDYLGFASDARLRTAAIRALEDGYGGAGASRLISGSTALHTSAEARLAVYVQRDEAVLFASGYAANLGAVQAVVGPGDLVLSDALNHASLVDACRLSRATVRVYRHADPEHLAELLRVERPHHGAALVVTDAVFSMDGDQAPLAALRALADAHDAGLLVDEAHSLGVLGPEGRGLCVGQAVRADVIVGTLGKAFGAQGAFVAGDAEVARLVRHRARSYVYSTAPYPAVAAHTVAAVGLVQAADDRRQTLLAHAARLRFSLQALGYDVADGATPIVPLRVGTPEATMALSQALFERGVFVQGIRPPTVPVGTSRLRIVPTAAHTEAQLDRALEVFAALRR